MSPLADTYLGQQERVKEQQGIDWSSKDEEEEQGGGGGGGFAGVSAPQDPWGALKINGLPNDPNDPFNDKIIRDVINGNTQTTTTPSNYTPQGEWGDNPSPSPEPTPTQPTGGSGTPWMMYSGVGSPAFGQNMLYSNPLYPSQPTDWRQQGGGVDNARMNNNNPMPQVTKWNAPPVPDVTMIPNKPITPQEVTNITPQVMEAAQPRQPYTPGMGAGADTMWAQAQEPKTNKTSIFTPNFTSGQLLANNDQPNYLLGSTKKVTLLPKKKLNAFGGGGGGGGGRGPNWKAALDTMNWNI